MIRENNLKNRAISFFLTIAILASTFVSYGFTVKASDDIGSVIGSTARIVTSSVLLASNPEYVATDVIGGVSKNELPELVVITNYYYDEINNQVWYEIDAAPGYEWPDEYMSYHYVYDYAIEILTNGTNYIFDENGNEIGTYLDLQQFEKLHLVGASSMTGDVEYSWQVLIDGVWVDIYGQNKPEFTLSLGVIASALDDNCEAHIRLVTRKSSKVVEGDAITVTVIPYVEDKPDEDEPQEEERPAEYEVYILCDGEEVTEVTIEYDDYDYDNNPIENGTKKLYIESDVELYDDIIWQMRKDGEPDGEWEDIENGNCFEVSRYNIQGYYSADEIGYKAFVRAILISEEHEIISDEVSVYINERSDELYYNESKEKNEVESISYSEETNEKKTNEYADSSNITTNEGEEEKIDLTGADSDTKEELEKKINKIDNEEDNCEIPDNNINEEETSSQESTFTEDEDGSLLSAVFSMFSMTVYAAEEEQEIVSVEDETEIVVTEDENQMYNVIIEYKFEKDGTTAANPYTATLGENSSLDATVEFPNVLGYEPYVMNDNGELIRQDEYKFEDATFTEDFSLTVWYKPALVEYKVNVYFQNVTNDDYTMQSTEVLEGYTDTEIPVDLGLYFEGFIQLLHNQPKIAADGSTQIDVYFDRLYYLMKFELGDSAYGVQPIYARYGTQLNIDSPKRPGYTFNGWDDITETHEGANNGLSDTLPNTMPNEDTVWKALWIEPETAKVAVVFWGENANDEGYAYIESNDIYVKPGTEITYDEGAIICGIEEHTHTDNCAMCGEETHSHSIENNCYILNCGQEEHTSHTDSCYVNCEHEHNFLCNIFGCTHAHDDTCLSCDGHIHTDACYILNCDSNEHSHSSDCYDHIEHAHQSSCYLETDAMDNSLWSFVKTDTVTVNPDGSTVLNVYYDRKEFTLHFRKTNSQVDDYGTITDKWGANIEDEFYEACDKAGYDSWSEESNGDSPWTNHIECMPQQNRTYYSYTGSGNKVWVMTYFKEDLTKEYQEAFTVELHRSRETTVSKEEFIDIEGFTFNADRSTKTGSSTNGAKFYYDRNDYSLEFNNGYEVVKTEAVPYEKSLSGYKDFVPELPTELYEDGSREFVGWYLNPECTGERVNLEDLTMPAKNMILYAKWALVTHEVSIYRNKNADGSFDESAKIIPSFNISHGDKITGQDHIPEEPDNGNYNFVGWFYIDEDGREQAWDFNEMTVTHDINIYAKWDSQQMIPYTINYKLEDGTKIADPTTGSALAGTNKAFDAKGGTELYKDYQEGYFPLTQSHSVHLDINASEVIFDFVYVQKDAVPYTVRYLEKGTHTVLHEAKVVSDNRKAVVTENYEQINGYMPDEFQKTLIVSADNNAVNEIIFYYTEDKEHAGYQVRHYLQNTDGTTYREVEFREGTGAIGDIITEGSRNYAGYQYNAEKSTSTGTLSANTLLKLNLYYDRLKYPYRVQYIDKDTGKEIATEDIFTGDAMKYYGDVVTVTAKSISNYSPISTAVQHTITVEKDDNLEEPIANLIKIYYVEEVNTINYVVVGPDGCGTVSPGKTDVKVISDNGASSTARANDGYMFVGWYSDSECKNQLTTKETLVLEKPESGWKPATYYAKFEYALASLTITKSGANGIDENQSFIFRIKGVDEKTAGIDLQVVIKGNESVTINELPIGSYDIIEEVDWSWRYTPDENNQTRIELNPLDKNEIPFKNNRTKKNWLNGATHCENLFTIKEEEDENE